MLYAVFFAFTIFPLILFLRVVYEAYYGTWYQTNPIKIIRRRRIDDSILSLFLFFLLLLTLIITVFVFFFIMPSSVVFLLLIPFAIIFFS
jgi:hypothetical protein